MATNSQVKPLGQSINRFARAKAAEQIALQGKSLPCTVTAVRGSIVTVAFQIAGVSGQAAPTLYPVTIPIIGSEYIRIPVQVGMKGMTVAADAALGGMSGIGGGVATMIPPANLTALAFVPLGNVGFFAVDGNVLVLYGPNGVTLQDQSGASTLKLTPTQISMTAGGKTLTINSAGIAIDGIVWETHQHTGVQTGSGETGGPIA